MSFQLTKNEILKEILKSGKDPTYFITNYAKIAHPLEGLLPFKLYDFQEELVKNFNDHRFNVILKARQLGISTTTAAYIAWMLLFHRNKNVRTRRRNQVPSCFQPRKEGEAHYEELATLDADSVNRH